MDVPDAAWIRERSDISFDEYGYIEPEEGDPDRLQNKVDESLAELTGILASIGVKVVWEDVPDPPDTLAVLLQTVLRMLTEYNTARGQQEILDGVTDFDLIQSFSVGPLSETRRTMSANATLLHPWPALNKLLKVIDVVATGDTSGSNDGPVIQGVDPMIPKPGADVMERRYPWHQPFGPWGPGWHAPGVYRIW